MFQLSFELESATKVPSYNLLLWKQACWLGSEPCDAMPAECGWRGGWALSGETLLSPKITSSMHLQVCSKSSLFSDIFCWKLYGQHANVLLWAQSLAELTSPNCCTGDVECTAQFPFQAPCAAWDSRGPCPVNPLKMIYLLVIKEPKIRWPTLVFPGRRERIITLQSWNSFVYYSHKKNKIWYLLWHRTKRQCS